jgi:LacI family transcriptional regulator
MPVRKKIRRRVALVLELEWPYRRHVDVYLGTQRYARECGRWDCVIDEFPDLSPGKPAYDGIIARATPALAARARRCEVPLVNVWHNSSVVGVPGVFPDFQRAGRLAAEHLLERGLRRFACVLFPGNQTHQALHRGFSARLREEDYDCSSHAADGDHATRSAAVWQRFRTTLADWVASWQRPVGVFVAFSGYTARHLVNACNCAGLRMPEDVALVVADNDLPVCLQPPPTLTGVDLHYEQAGYEAARLLERLMNAKAPPRADLFVEPGGIQARQSTDFFAAEDELVVAAMRFIAEHVRQAIGVDDVARGVNASRRTLERRFRQVAGRCVFAEIRRLRIERAKRLLLDTDMPVKQVAHAAGFRAPVQMYQVFRHFVGVAPSEVRRAGNEK